MISKRWITIAIAVAVLAPTILQASPPPGDSSWTKLDSVPGQWLVLRAGSRNAGTKVLPPEEILYKLRPKTASFIVTYDGFTPAAEAAFQHAVGLVLLNTIAESVGSKLLIEDQNISC